MHPKSSEPTEAQWSIYLEVIREARARGIQVAIGGGFAVISITGNRHLPQSLDLYILPDDRERMLAVLADCGLTDYYDMLPYDREWIYRSNKDDAIIDVVWAMPNRRAQVDVQWISRGSEADFHGESVKILPPEELIWTKLYVLQRDRCDWPDILNVIHQAAPSLDWDHLVSRLGDDVPLLAAVLTVYGWLAPDRVAQIPVLVEILARPEHRRPDSIPREDLLDARPWFAGAPAA